MILSLFARGTPRVLFVAVCSGVVLGLIVWASCIAGLDPGMAQAGDAATVKAPVARAIAAVARTPPSRPAPEAPPRPAPASASRRVGGLGAARDLDCLAAAVYYEARGESAEGQAAVAQVVLNRTHQPSFPRSVCGVVFQGAASHACQFSFACNGAMNGAREVGAWLRARTVAARALGGYVMAAVGHATRFHAARLGGGEQAMTRVGGHVFFGQGGPKGDAGRQSLAEARPDPTPAPSAAPDPASATPPPTGSASSAF